MRELLELERAVDEARAIVRGQSERLSGVEQVAKLLRAGDRRVTEEQRDEERERVCEVRAAYHLAVRELRARETRLEEAAAELGAVPVVVKRSKR
jgi:hypothetical protein